jgi:hypothetical protein
MVSIQIFHFSFFFCPSSFFLGVPASPTHNPTHAVGLRLQVRSCKAWAARSYKELTSSLFYSRIPSLSNFARFPAPSSREQNRKRFFEIL